MSAPNSPQATSGWRSRARARKYAYSRRACSGGAAVLKPGRVPLRVSAARVNCGTTSRAPPRWERSRFIRPASSGKIR